VPLPLSRNIGRMRPRRHHSHAAVALVAIATLVAGSLPRGARAHDATDAPARSSEESRPRPAGAQAASRTSIAWPLLLVGVGAATTGAGGWLLHDESRAQGGSCVGGPSGRASCASPSEGPGLGLAVLLVGAQATLGGLVWLAVRWHEGPVPVALQLGPGTLALRAAF